MERNRIYQILWVLGLLLTGLSCSKDELTKPAPVNLQMAMGNNEASLRVQNKTLIRIEKTRYRFSSVEFEGNRQSGPDYFFTKEFTEGHEVMTAENEPGHVLNFDMPQGIYERVKISLKVKKSSDRESSDGNKKKDSAIPWNKDAAVIMEGFYTNTHQKQIPLIFVYDFDETFEYNASPKAGKEGIAVEKSQNNFATIEFNTAYWMQLINGRMLQSAKLTSVEGVETIIISEFHNDHIFNLLTSRIKDASELTFN